jgi:4-oxalocrotonate tautomerase
MQPKELCGRKKMFVDQGGIQMPFAQIHILEGRTPEQKRKMLEEVTVALIKTLGVPRENVRIIIHEIPKGHWSVGGLTMEERDRHDPASRS